MRSDQRLDGADHRHVVVLSDIHLGTERPTVWYQRELHEPYLVHVLDWVVANAAAVRELVLLGDVVDLWTYPADEVPPTFADIVATHPAVFGLDGALARVLDALDGQVTYVTGNHDMGITAAEVAAIRSPGGHHVRLAEGAVHHPGGDRRLALTHGHDFTLFNATDPDSPWAPLPVGYFVTRAVATSWIGKLADGQTVADLPGQGAPNGLDLGSLGAIAAGLGARSISASLLDFVAGATGVGPEVPITMPDGSTTTLAEVRDVFASCWSDWAAQHGGGVVGTASAYRAAMADADGSYLGWFAQQLAFSGEAELVVMGHTHLPVAGLDCSPIRYVNTGFDCPSGPDMDGPRQQRATFAVIDAEALEAEIWAVAPGDGGELRCGPHDAPIARVVSGRGADYSCYVTVDNRDGDADLVLVDSKADYGAFVSPPPEVIPAGTRARFWIQDTLGPSGSAGWATYRRGDDELPLRFACPTLGTNTCAGADRFATRAANGPWQDQQVARWGHPFFVTFTP